MSATTTTVAVASLISMVLHLAVAFVLSFLVARPRPLPPKRSKPSLCMKLVSVQPQRNTGLTPTPPAPEKPASTVLELKAQPHQRSIPPQAKPERNSKPVRRVQRTQPVAKSAPPLPKPAIAPTASHKPPSKEPAAGDQQTDESAAERTESIKDIHQPHDKPIPPGDFGHLVALYRQRVRAKIETSAERSYPMLARRRGLEGNVILRLEVSHSGKLLHVELAEPCEHTLLNRAAHRAVKRAAPFGLFPPGLPRDKLVFVVPISYTLR